MFDLSSRKKFFELKSNDPEYQDLMKVSIEIEQNSKNLVYQLFFTFLCLSCSIDENFFNTSEDKFYESITERIKLLNFS